jgi:hypothetical protein
MNEQKEHEETTQTVINSDELAMLQTASDAVPILIERIEKTYGISATILRDWYLKIGLELLEVSE